MKQHAHGFTLVELVVTLALVAMITAFGVPMFERLITNNRLTAQANDFISALLFTRTEAVKRGVRVTVCKSGDGAACTASGGWEQGWIAFTDTGTLLTVDGTDTILRTGSALPATFAFTGSTNVASYVSYLPSGRTQMVDGTAQSGTLLLRHTRLGDFERRISISRTGRAEVQQ